MSDMDDVYPRDHACRRCGYPDDECACVTDADAPARCLHGIEMGGHRYCPDCAVAAETMLAEAFARVLARIQREQDETMGAALAARDEKGETS